MTTIYRFAGAELHREERRLLVQGNDSGIGARAFDVLLTLIERQGELVGKHELIDRVWPGLVVEENNLPVQISALRKLLGARVIATIPGRGYRFTASLVGAVPASPDTASVASSANPPSATNLPVHVPTLFGREGDLATLRTLMASHALVTVAGAGGIGKTTLARTAAHRVRDEFEDGVWAIEFAPVAEPTLVASTVAGALRVVLGAEAPVETLARSLSASRMLIVFDNCEHLLPAIAELAAELHRQAPGVRLLATSQEPLKLPHEHVYRLGPLTLPDDDGLDGARQSGACALFETRARAADPRFSLSEFNLAAVVDVCRRLDGIALAIELAAARVPLLGVDGLRALLDERFQVLTSGARLALPRHRTLRAAMTWSHDLLTSDERIVFRRLGVFVGSFGLASAQHVAAHEHIDDWAVLDLLGALIDKSMATIVVEGDAAPRYRLLETSRTFALEELHRTSETEAVRRRHAEAMLAVFERGLSEEFELSAPKRLAHYLPDLDNARAALEWSAHACDAPFHIALSGAVAWIWIQAGLRPEGYRRAKAAIAMLAPDTVPAHEARLLRAWPWLSHPLVGPDELAACARVVEIYRRLGDRRALFAALCNQARYQPYCDKLEEAEQALQEAQQILDASWPATLRVRLRTVRASLRSEQGRIEESTQDLMEMQRVAIAVDDKDMLLSSSINLEQNAASRGLLEESVTRGHEMVRLMQQDRTLRSANEHFVLVNLNMSLIQLGRIDEALEVSRSVWPIMKRLDRTMDVLEQCALLAFKRGRVEDAARMMGRADLEFATTHNRRDPVEQGIRKTLEASLIAALPASEFARLRADGKTLSIEEAVLLALR